MSLRALVLAGALAALGCGGPRGAGGPLLIHCTASLGSAMEEVCGEYAREQGGPPAEINSASSLLLRRQIEAEAPGDLFVSAADGHMDALNEAGLIDGESRVELLRNRMAFLVRVESGLRSLDDLASPNIRVALANEGVPAGDYARALLESAGLWDEISRSVLPFPHEPAVLRAIQRGLIPAAFVYGSSVNALRDDLIRELPLDATLQPAVRYPGAVLKRSRKQADANRFLKFLQQPKAQAIFERHGFIPLIRS